MRSGSLRRVLTVGILLMFAGTAMYLWQHSQPAGLLPGIATANGRLEATEVDVATKVAGRLAAIHVREGDAVAHDQAVAELDADNLKAQLLAAEAQVRQACAATQQSHADMASATSQQKLARVTLFLCGATLYLFSAASIGIFLGTLARSMPQFGLLFILTIIPLQMLSGGVTPRESMPQIVQDMMLGAPTTYFVRLAQGILYRGAGFETVWPDFIAIAGIGAVFFVAALVRFRRSVTLTQI